MEGCWEAGAQAERANPAAVREAVRRSRRVRARGWGWLGMVLVPLLSYNGGGGWGAT